MCKTAIPQFLQNRTKNRARPHHRKPLRPLQHDSSEFFYRHIEFQENHRERRGRERERERATVELELARTPPPPPPRTFSTDKKKISGTQGRVYLWFQYVSFCVTRIYLACAAWSFSREAIVWQFRVLCNYYFLLHNIKFALSLTRRTAQCFILHFPVYSLWT